MSSARDSLLLLADGYTARGSHLGRRGTTVGKLVFNTSMTGYHEILTDPSYAGEIITFTFPLQGIYGVCPADAQSERIHARGVIVGERSERGDSWRSALTLNDLLLSMEVVGLAGVDTRRLTRHIRDTGEMLGIITSELSEGEAQAELAKHPDFGQQDLVPEVSCKEPYVTRPGDFDPARLGPLGQAELFTRGKGEGLTVAAYDFGIKLGILECFAARGVTVHVFPCTAAAEELLAVKPDGVFLSNGPGDPERMDYALDNVRALMDRLPTFGICLGHQLMARAAGIPTYRLKFGNRGANHPVLDLASGRVHISSQNHSYAVTLDDTPAGRPAAAADGRERAPLGPERPQAPYPHPLNPDVSVTHLNVNDGSNEGLAWRDKPAFSVQYHPEGCPGPRDNVYLFDQFCQLMVDQ
jgi:carbamoyl-phosphate synthase small subunit